MGPDSIMRPLLKVSVHSSNAVSNPAICPRLLHWHMHRQHCAHSAAGPRPESHLSRQHAHNAQHLLAAAQVHAGYQHLGHRGVHWELCHLAAQAGQQTLQPPQTKVHLLQQWCDSACLSEPQDSETGVVLGSIAISRSQCDVAGLQLRQDAVAVAESRCAPCTDHKYLVEGARQCPGVELLTALANEYVTCGDT